METIGGRSSRAAGAEARRLIEGEDRVAALPQAAFIAVSVGSEPGDPVVVFIGWSAALAEQAYPGTSIWRAAVQSFLRSPPTDDPGNPIVRIAAAESLERFPSLDRWLQWHDHERQARSERRERERRERNRLFGRWIGHWW